MLDCVKDKEHTVKIIVLMGTPSADLVSRGQQAGIHILSLQEMEVIWSFIHLSFLCFMYFSVLVLSCPCFPVLPCFVFCIVGNFLNFLSVSFLTLTLFCYFSCCVGFTLNALVLFRSF